MKKYGLIGYPLSHSFSQEFFNKKFRKEGLEHHYYHLYPIKEIGELKDILDKEPNLQGLNVTIPHKVSVIPFLDDLDDVAKEIDAVNVIQIKRIGGKIILKGFNSDVYGFSHSLQPLLHAERAKALILGTGGASKAVAYALKQLSIPYFFVSRQPKPGQYSYKVLNEATIQAHSLIINCSPLGTFPDISQCPDIPYEYLGKQHILYDLVYNPERTLFLKKGSEKGSRIKNGLEMLHLQAEKAWQIWQTI